MRCARIVKSFGEDRSGATALLFALALPGMLGLIGGAVDYAALARQQGFIKHAADSAALSVARQMTMMQMTDAQMQAAAQQFAEANATTLGLQGLSLRATPSSDRLAIRIEANARAKTPLGIGGLLAGVDVLASSATARVGQETKLCLLSVSDAKTTKKASNSGLFVSKEPIGINLSPGSRLSAPGCLLHTNISTKTAFQIGAGALVKANIVCAAGGIQNNGGLVDAAVLDSCPRVQNPIEHRIYPNVGKNCEGKDYNDVVFRSGTHTLSPGQYCGNVKILGDAKVRMLPGIYTIQGRLIAADNAELVGERVGIYLDGGYFRTKRHAYFSFTGNALIDLSAPETGEMAGFLIWEGIDGAAHDQRAGAKDVNFHQINTARAKRLTGTIYLPGGRLLIDAPVKVAEESDYTVLLVNRLDLEAGPNLVLNSNYSKSRVPVPAGLGSLGAKNVRLEK